MKCEADRFFYSRPYCHAPATLELTERDDRRKVADQWLMCGDHGHGALGLKPELERRVIS